MKNKNIVILGAGESGTGAAVLASRRDMRVFVSDNGPIAQHYKATLERENISFEENGHTHQRILGADLIIKSPGIPDKAALIKKVKEKNIDIVDEMEFAFSFTEAKIIAITGSNGKSTTASLIAHILEKSGKKVSLAGNIGQSFAMAVATEKPDIFVLEVSSFQLDYLFSFKADIAVLTNITPDHLDRYDHQFQKYVDSKFRILQNMTATDHLIYCADDQTIINELNKRTTAVQLLPFSLKTSLKSGAYLQDNKLIFTGKNTFTMTLEELALQGRHNVYNSLAAGLATKLIDIRKENIKQCLSDFENIPHRLELAATIHGIDFINDSKATNINSTWYALESVNKPIIWIVGGLDKGNDYSKLTQLASEKVKAIICLGIDNQHIAESFSGVVEEIYETQSMKDAVNWSYKLANDGETVLLSPACASFDLFDNYEDRGNKFKKAVKEL
ncbi:MAG TPA: UDP-N-acetylmuramoyl-L-alanine--D-glutamate ligase [Bacteroidales bacterium]|nr:UDP-N-acetylmuramoyl-L-alanine--D-glutamate ligase [Bacteroidales bacterium]